MNIHDDTELGFASLAVRAGQVRTSEGEHAEPIFLTSSFVFANAAEAATRFSTATGNIYSRFTNPTVRASPTRPCAFFRSGWRRWKAASPASRPDPAWRRFWRLAWRC